MPISKTNIMVMAGTKDAAIIIEKLSKTEKFRILATTTTNYGADIAKSAGADEIISKALKKEKIIETIKNNNIQFLIDATHPFAASATFNAINASKITGIKYIRFERPQIELPENNLIYKVFSFEEAALKSLELTKGNILHLAGVSTLKPVIEKIDPSRLFTRVLPSLDSIGKCLDLGLKQENIMAMQGTFSKNFNKALIEEYDISLIITKESGETGGTPSKINAALDLDVNVVIVVRPEIKELENQTIFNNIDKIYNFLLK
ncbi:precorrin-6A reductase [Methanobacterium oryzae]|uniref:precorrin-6A reductase n=1 Tax=Methanobacterium oryzae TaxID=69540 RepID=UPI003D2618FE